MKLKDIHNRIDQIDNKILSLLEKRFKLSLETLSFKKVIENPQRESNILHRLKGQSRELPPEIIENIFQSIFSESKRRQRNKLDARLDNS